MLVLEVLVFREVFKSLIFCFSCLGVFFVVFLSKVVVSKLVVFVLFFEFRSMLLFSFNLNVINGILLLVIFVILMIDDSVFC